jgi:hypothetical protein
MKHILKLSQDLEDMFWLDVSEEDFRENPEVRKAYKEVKKIQKRIKQLDETLNPKPKFSWF